MKYALSIVLVLFVCIALAVSLFGVSTECRLGLYWGSVETTRDVYFRLFPLLKANLQSSTRPLQLQYNKDGLEPEWILSEDYRDKGGKRMNLKKVLDKLESSDFQNRINTDQKYANKFKSMISPVVKDTEALMKFLNE